MNRHLILFSAFALVVPAGMPAQEYKCMRGLDIRVGTCVHYYYDNRVIRTTAFPESGALKFKEGEWKRTLEVREQTDHETEAVYTFELTGGTARQAGVSVVFSFGDWSTENYVIMPSALYDGNRFDVLPYPYNPLFKRKDYGVEKPITITDVPRLNKYQGESKAEFTTGDLSTPAIGVFFPSMGKGLWILTEQGSGFGNHGLTIRENDARTKAEFSIVSPVVREKGYRITAVQAKSDDKSVDWNRGDRVTIRFKAFTFDTECPGDLNDFFLRIRKSIYHQERIDQLPFSKAFELIENKYNSENWVAAPGYYAVGDRSAWCMDWQLGWTGGCIATLPLSLNGKPFSRKRSFVNYGVVITRSQSRSGLFYTCSNGEEWVSDCSLAPHPDSLTLLRKNADALYYIYKYCTIEQSINQGWIMPREWQLPLERLADKFVSLWDQYGQFGQFLNIETGRIVVGGSNSASSAIGGLALAYQLEKKADYLRVAKEAARYYFDNFIKQGVSCGGPGEVLQNPDSESTFAMLESLVVLYEVTGEKEWLEYAETTAGLFSTWVVSYDYVFPDSSVFGKLNMKTTGSVWANTQNKHGAPGICTFSGDCLFKLYRATGNEYYLELILDIAHNLMQYVSRNDRQIADQKPGWVNERVNLSDWEGKDRVGNIFYGSTWPDASTLLTVTDIPGIYIEPGKKKITVFDHVQAEYSGDNKLTVTNPTRFDASVRVFIDPDPSRILDPGEIAFCDEIFVKAGQSREYQIQGDGLILEHEKEAGPVDHLIVR